VHHLGGAEREGGDGCVGSVLETHRGLCLERLKWTLDLGWWRSFAACVGCRNSWRRDRGETDGGAKTEGGESAACTSSPLVPCQYFLLLLAIMAAWAVSASSCRVASFLSIFFFKTKRKSTALRVVAAPQHPQHRLVVYVFLFRCFACF